MNHLPKELFFAVWDLPELRSLIRSFMWPGQRSATWYEYDDAHAAFANGYETLLLQRTSDLSFSKDCLYRLITGGRAESVIDAIIKCGVCKTTCKMCSVVTLIDDTRTAQKMFSLIEDPSDLVFYIERCSNAMFDIIFAALKRLTARRKTVWFALVAIARTPEQIENIMSAYGNDRAIKEQVIMSAVSGCKLSVINWFMGNPIAIGEHVQDHMMSHGHAQLVATLYEKGMCVPTIDLLKQYCRHRLYTIVNALVYDADGIANEYCALAARHCYGNGDEIRSAWYHSDALDAGWNPPYNVSFFFSKKEKARISSLVQQV